MLQLGSYGLGVFAISVGTTLLLQDPARMSTPGWQVALTLFGPAFWGGYLLLAGVVMLAAIPFGHRGQYVLGCASIAIAAAIGLRAATSIAALDQPTASGTAPQFFVAMTAIYLAHGIAHLRR